MVSWGWRQSQVEYVGNVVEVLVRPAIAEHDQFALCVQTELAQLEPDGMIQSHGHHNHAENQIFRITMITCRKTELRVEFGFGG